MLRVIGCSTESHDPALVALACLVCLLAVDASTHLAVSRDEAVGGPRGIRDGAAIVAFSVGVWTTHFISFLAYRPGVPFSFDIALCVLSLVLVTGTTTLAFVICRRANAFAAVAACGTVLAGGVATMHFVGMLAVVAPGVFHYDPGVMAASVVVGGLWASIGVWLLIRNRPNMACLALILAILSIHYIGIGAVTLQPALGASLPSLGASPLALATVTGGTALLIVALALAASIREQHHGNRLAREARRFRTLANATSEGIIFERDGRVVDVNGAMCRLAGNDAGTLIGLRIADLLPGLVLVPAGDERRDEHVVVQPDGTTTPVEVDWRDDADHDGHVLTVRDLSRQKQAEQQIDRLARLDPLTGLANPIMFEQQLQTALAIADRGAGGVALHYVDLDRFETVDETYGPRSSEQILLQAASRLTEAVREIDTVARLGRGEFAIVQLLTDQPKDAAALGDRIVAEMASPFLLEAHAQAFDVNVGIALYPGDGETAADLIKSAALARRHAKHHGHGWRCFEVEMDLQLQAKRALEHDLRTALQHGQFCLHYQPFVAVQAQAVAGYEALLRWNHPTRGSVPPADFIPLAEACGLIVPIGEWVLATACAEAVSWDDPVVVSVNLSPAQFVQPGIVATIGDVLRRTGLPPARLELEITEGMLMDDTRNALQVLTALKALGVKIAMDDFGTGFSSLSYLRKFPFDKIKIDRSFISDVSDSVEAETIVRAIIALGRSLGLDVTAEGVETNGQLAMLRGLDCTFAQGYLLGRPHPADQIGQHLDRSWPAVGDIAQRLPVATSAG